MPFDYSAVPRMPDGRTAAEHIADVERRSEAIRTPMAHGGHMTWHVWGGGSGKPPLVLFHGGSGSWIHWIRNVLPLSEKYTVYAADAPGLGDSDPPEDTKDIWSVTRAVKAGLDVVLPKDGRFDIVGFSFGGMVGGHVSTLLDDRLRSVTLVGPGGFRMRRAPRGDLKRLTTDMSPQELVAQARRNLEFLMVHDPASLDGVGIHMQILNSTRAKTNSRSMSKAGVLSDCLPNIRHRLGAIWGAYDSTAHPYWEEREVALRGHQPDIDLRYIADGGHWIAYEKADEFNAMLLDMLASLPA